MPRTRKYTRIELKSLRRADLQNLYKVSQTPFRRIIQPRAGRRQLSMGS